MLFAKHGYAHARLDKQLQKIIERNATFSWLREMVGARKKLLLRLRVMKIPLLPDEWLKAESMPLLHTRLASYGNIHLVVTCTLVEPIKSGSFSHRFSFAGRWFVWCGSLEDGIQRRGSPLPLPILLSSIFRARLAMKVTPWIISVTLLPSYQLILYKNCLRV